MRGQVAPLRNRSTKVMPRKEVLGAVNSVLARTGSMAVTPIIVGLC